MSTKSKIKLNGEIKQKKKTMECEECYGTQDFSCFPFTKDGLSELLSFEPRIR